MKVKTPTRRAVGHTRPQPPQSQGKAKGHANVPKGPKPVQTPAAVANGKGPKQ